MGDYPRQAMLQRKILRTVENFKKIGQANVTLEKVLGRLSILEDVWIAFQEGHLALLASTTEEERLETPYFTEEQFDSTEDAYLIAKDYLLEAKASLEPKVVSPLQCPSDKGFISTVRPSLDLTHLPHVPLPPFDGDFNNWETFRDRFKGLIIANRDLSDSTRMHYLVSSLTGPALEAIQHISVTSDNFSIAWATLTSRFESKRILIKTHLSNLIDLPHVKQESASELQALIDRANAAVSSLKKLDRSPEQIGEDMLVHLVTRKLDTITLEKWTAFSAEKPGISTFTELSNYIASRTKILNEVALNIVRGSDETTTSATSLHVATPIGPVPHTDPASNGSYSGCPLCHSRHYLSNCRSYLAEPQSKRREIIIRLKRCLNCLSRRHATTECTSKYSCRVCQQRHHSSLHHEADSRAMTSASSLPRTVTANHVSDQYTLGGESAVTSLRASTSHGSASRVLLATAWVRVRVPSGQEAIIRALLDQGSEATLVSENLVQTLRAKRIPRNVKVSAVGGVDVKDVRSVIAIQITPVTSNTPVLYTTALVLPSLTQYRAQSIPDPSSLPYLAGLPLADADPSTHHPVDIIIGADLFGDVILNGLRKGMHGQPIAQQSIFGWVISGPIPSRSDDLNPSHSLLSHNVTIRCTSPDTPIDTLEAELRRFWEVECIPRATPRLTASERQCEEHFRDTHSRTSDGRFQVRLPFKQDPPFDIGQSRPIAEKMYRSLGRKFQKNPELRREYSAFMSEYERLGHMERVNTGSSLPDRTIYIPHHPVLRPSSSTTHLRVVFNASALTSNGRSLNDFLLSGPKLQTDLPSVILRWRHHRYVYTADIAKMYRQILVDPRDTSFQRILWHDSPSQAPHEFSLRTVTYGMTCAPFLALRVLQQLAFVEGADFPLAIPILKDQIYVDDVLFGDDTLDTVRTLRDQLTGLLRRGKFELRKWASNSPTLLQDIDPTNHGLACSIDLAVDDSVKVLGVSWNPSRDQFIINIALPTVPPRTKRSILATIAKLYDPLGWVTPATITAKIFMQTLWRRHHQWDEPLSLDLVNQWETIYSGLSQLHDLSLARWTGLLSNAHTIELHGFSDASSYAYAAVVYLKVITHDGTAVISLLTGKSKVAPITPTSVPRLELSAAVLLAHLIEFVRPSLGSRSVSCYCWTDSSIVLAWLRDHPSRWKTFVAHRVHDIQCRVPDSEWRHVPTSCNPADCASRGLFGQELRDHPLWWTGPQWLRWPQHCWPSDPPAPTDVPLSEARSAAVHTCSQTSSWTLASRFSSWAKLIRITAYLFKFIHALHARKNTSSPISSNGRTVSVDECSEARIFWIKSIQREQFPTELEALTHGRSLSTKSSIMSLNPFIDSDGILRVGGRLHKAPIPIAQKHPILLASHSLVDLIISQAHLQTLHGGVQLTLSTLRREFWILSARSLVKRVIHRCVVCVRERAKVPEQLMGSLPAARVNSPLQCFSHCGVDYAGPVQVRASAGRGIKTRKAYIALFICLASRAIHLELVGDYSTPAFLNAFDRFCSRRGLPSDMYSDNGTTFAGANNELARAYRAALRDPNFQNKSAHDKISWHFIPPVAPHFGGLWEAGVRSVKHHLRRVLGDRMLSFEEFTTLLCRIEACLNSRPIAPLSDALDDCEPLTPGHFLIGTALTTSPEPSVLHLNENRLSRWQLVRHKIERFWRLWQSDYVNTLQQRSRWRQTRTPLELGQLVLIRHPTAPPCKWKLGRVTRLHPGSDGLTRVVTVRTAHSEFQRPIVQLCALPVSSSSTSN
ncbi:uncharacterized protein LOC143219631 [Lasioglossum baleicum]|uniref:uncharacterized protein LOC143219631 n=1 Tax=Lasioglossum baleicum TaxID=434251 RepID=UPI003FCDA68D